MSGGDKVFNLVLWILLAGSILLAATATLAWLFLGVLPAFLLGARWVDGPGAGFW